MSEVEDFEALASAELNDFDTALRAAYQMQLRLVHGVSIRKDVHRSIRVLLNLAVGDLGDLIEDARRGSGRSATRAARTLIESAINMHTICDSAEDADRYLAHLDLGPILLATIAPGHDLLPRAARSAYLHRLRREAKLVEGPWAEAMERYGSGFKRSWHPRNLRDRATAAGREEIYESYRVASLVVHGSAAGASFGQLRVNTRDRLAFLTGRIPFLCPTALLLGIDAYLEVIKVVGASVPDVDISLAWDSLQVAAESWPDYAKLVDRYMIDAWSLMKDAAPSQMTYAAFSRGDKRRWYARTSFDTSLLMHAYQPTLTERKRDELEAVISAYRSDPDAVFSPGGWAAVSVSGVAAQVNYERRGIPLLAYPVLIANDDDSWTVYSADHGEVRWVPYA